MYQHEHGDRTRGTAIVTSPQPWQIKTGSSRSNMPSEAGTGVSKAMVPDGDGVPR